MSLPRLLRGALVVAGATLALAGPLASTSAGHALLLRAGGTTKSATAAAAPAETASGLSGHRAVAGPSVRAELPSAALTGAGTSANELSNTLEAAPALAAARHTVATALVANGAVAASAAASLDAASRDADSRAVFAEAIKGTYLGDVIKERDGALSRWPRRVATPVRVWVDSASAVRLRGWRASFPAKARGAFETWSSLDIPVRFVFVDDPAQAEVHLRWVERLDQESCGETTWTTDAQGWMRRGDITLAMRASDGALQDETDIRAMALHEVGHLLGLGHTADSTAIMAPWVAADELSSADRATIRLLYALPPGRVRKAD
jgi:hypothetical protein